MISKNTQCKYQGLSVLSDAFGWDLSVRWAILSKSVPVRGRSRLVGGVYLIQVDLTMMSERKNGDRKECRNLDSDLGGRNERGDKYFS